MRLHLSRSDEFFSLTGFFFFKKSFFFLWFFCLYGFLPQAQAQALHQWSLTPQSTKKTLELSENGVPRFIRSTFFELNPPIREATQWVVMQPYGFKGDGASLVEAWLLNASEEKVAVVKFDAKQKKFFLSIPQLLDGNKNSEENHYWVRSLEILPSSKTESEVDWVVEDASGTFIHGYSAFNPQQASVVYWQKPKDGEGAPIQLFEQRHQKGETPEKISQLSRELESWTDDSELELLWMAALTGGFLDQAFRLSDAADQPRWWAFGSKIAALVSLPILGAFLGSWTGGGGPSGGCGREGTSGCHCSH